MLVAGGSAQAPQKDIGLIELAESESSDLQTALSCVGD